MNKLRKQHHSSLTPLQKGMLFVYKNTATVYFFLFCCLLLITGSAAPQIQGQVFFISSGVIQLLMLPILNFGQDYQSSFDDIRAEHALQVAEQNEEILQKILSYVSAIHYASNEAKKGLDDGNSQETI